MRKKYGKVEDDERSEKVETKQAKNMCKGRGEDKDNKECAGCSARECSGRGNIFEGWEKVNYGLRTKI
jgi:hypothetical protein